MLADHPVYTTLPVSDMERATAFYRDKLGLTAKEDRPDGSKYYVGNNTGFLLFPSPFAGTSQATAAGFETPNVRAEVEELQSRGVEFMTFEMEGVTWDGVIASMAGIEGAWFKDSEGNIIAVANPG
ncbi:MAG: VOC family protein [Actinomycetota bacterium]|nr:VOC family protein [Actinomycetota bacterium]MDH5224424.1 VOC family protein [Actinomycetota bacterium]MDH5313591.1 VOC family protein [Actinomycetota bacterium]